MRRAIVFSSGPADRQAIDQLDLPRSVREAILRRLDGLDAVTLQVVDTAATVGRYFDFAVLQEVTGLSEDALLVAVKHLLNQQLIHWSAASAGITRAICFAMR